MALVLDTGILRENLCKAKEREIPADYNLKESLLEVSKGLRYLVENVLDPLSEDRPVHSANLDFSQFNENDLADLYDYYMEVCFDGTKDWYSLKAVYKGCLQAEAQTAPVQFL